MIEFKLNSNEHRESSTYSVIEDDEYVGKLLLKGYAWKYAPNSTELISMNLCHYVSIKLCDLNKLEFDYMQEKLDDSTRAMAQFNQKK